MPVSLSTAISSFGLSVKAKLTSPAVTGEPEDQLRGPLETLLGHLAGLCGLPEGSLGLIGETTLSELKTRPDYAVTVHKVLVGFIEVKAPGKGADPRRFSDPHDKAQWGKLKALPNVLYTDGRGFSVWHSGEIDGSVVHLDGELQTAGKALAAPATLLPLIGSFLNWAPQPIRRAKTLAEVSARLCRFLRDEVIEQLALGSEGLSGLARDWRKLLFPEANDETFADGYAQAVTFGLLVARARDIPLDNGIDAAAQELRKTNSLIGTALRLLTDDAENQKALKTGLGTLTRVLHQVQWADITKSAPDAWLYFYEEFLEVYDSRLRKRTGSYYTPPEVVDAMVRLVDEVLRGPLFNRPQGLAAADVTIADPAVGTGTFLLGVLRRIARTVADDQGEGAVRGAVAEAAKRLVGFELQFGPFAVAQLRILAEMQALMALPGQPAPPSPDLKLFITDTLANPFVEEEMMGQLYAPIAKSRRDANRIKREQPITVVIGNPPYKEKAEGRGGWIESGTPGREKPLQRWQPPVSWKVGAHAKHLRNLYVYFWRWATWKVFGSGYAASTGLPEADREGVICFITVAGFLNGPGFQRMRDDLRRTCSDIWVVDCSPEGHQPEVATRIFQGVQQPVCIVLAARQLAKAVDVPARLHFHTLSEGRREVKFASLAELQLDAKGWADGASGWRDPLLPKREGTWAEYPALRGLFTYNGSGVMPGRTWVIAPDADSLNERWSRLIKETSYELKKNLFHPHLRNKIPADKHLDKAAGRGLIGHQFRAYPVSAEVRTVIPPLQYGFRSFDRQWLIPDGRLLNQPNPALWEAHSSSQVHLTALEAHSPSSGPAITLTALIPDLDHYKGSFGGRVYPLWRDAAAAQPNIRPPLMAFLAETFGHEVGAEDVMAYLAAVMAHPAYTTRFAADLVRPGLRVPLTADSGLFAEAAALGREVVWLHCYGERFVDPAAGRPKGPPRLPKGERPSIPAAGAIPGAPEPLPDAMTYDPANGRLHVGKGFVANVTPAMWAYEVSGKHTLRHWFSYRRRDRSRPVIGGPPAPLGPRPHPAGPLAERVHDGPDRPAERLGPVDHARAGSGRAARPHLRRPAACGGGAAGRRRGRTRTGHELIVGDNRADALARLGGAAAWYWRPRRTPP